jgi:hypothetical protein
MKINIKNLFNLMFIIVALIPLLSLIYYRNSIKELFNPKTNLYWVKNKQIEKDRVILGENIDSSLVSPEDALYIDSEFFDEQNINSGLELYIGSSLHSDLNKLDGNMIQKTRDEILPYYKNDQVLNKLTTDFGTTQEGLDTLNTELCFSNYENINKLGESCLTVNEIKALKGEMKFKLQNKQWGESNKFMKIVPEPLNSFETSGMKCGYALQDLNKEDSNLFKPNPDDRY